MLDVKDVSALGQIFNHTFGYSSDTMKVTSSLHGDSLVLKYIAVIQFAGEESMQQQKPKYEKEANDAIANALKNMKSKFKDITGRSIKVTEESREDSVELISMAAHTPRRLAYYRMNIHLKVE
jgi:hypothetical protein